LVLVAGLVTGPAATVAVRLALDTGATDTAINADPLARAGYDPALAPTRVDVTTGSTVESVPVLTIARLTALGQDRTLFPVLGLTFPPSAGIDGVLGLDFLRGKELNINFRTGMIRLT
jgi:hypothetical protein